MNITKKEAEKICNSYNLGELSKVTPFSGGWVNYNFKIETRKGVFVAQVFGVEFDKPKKEKMKLQFKILDFLKNKKFPYEIPEPIKNKNKNYFMKYKDRYLWVYKYIKGEVHKKLTLKEFKDVAKLTATYHKLIAPLGNVGNKNFNLDWLLEKYSAIEKRKPKNKLDKLVHKNLNFFSELLKKTKKINYGRNVMIHSDFNDKNILFSNGRLTGLIDFDNIEPAPIMRDIALALIRTGYKGYDWSEFRQGIFLREYRKIFPLSKKEENLILPLVLIDFCIIFWWYYEGMEKNRDKAYKCVNDIIKEAKRLEKIWRDKNDINSIQ